MRIVFVVRGLHEDGLEILDLEINVVLVCEDKAK